MFLSLINLNGSGMGRGERDMSKCICHIVECDKLGSIFPFTTVGTWDLMPLRKVRVEDPVWDNGKW